MTSTQTLTIVCSTFVAAMLVACGDTLPVSATSARTSAGAASNDVRSVGGYRLIGTPIAAVATTPNGITTGNVTFRTNKALPRRERRVAANIRLDGASGAAPAIRAGDGRRYHCYIQAVDEFPHSAQTGDRTLLTVKIRGIKRQLRMTLTFIDHQESRRRYKQLCGPRKLFDDPDA